MVACDNTECEYQWVCVARVETVSCVNVTLLVSSSVCQSQTTTPGGVVLFRLHLKGSSWQFSGQRRT